MAPTPTRSRKQGRWRSTENANRCRCTPSLLRLVMQRAGCGGLPAGRPQHRCAGGGGVAGAAPRRGHRHRQAARGRRLQHARRGRCITIATRNILTCFTDTGSGAQLLRQWPTTTTPCSSSCDASSWQVSATRYSHACVLALQGWRMQRKWCCAPSSGSFAGGGSSRRRRCRKPAQRLSGPTPMQQTLAHQL